jgi:hypothetical protein
MLTQVWDDKKHILLGDVVHAHFFVFADPAKVQTDLEHAFAFQVDFRVAGIEIAHAPEPPPLNPLANGPIGTSAISPTVGSVGGSINDFRATDVSDKAVTFTDPAGTAVHFLVVGTADVPVPVADLLSLVPVLGTIIRFVPFLPKTVRFNIGHDDIRIPITRDAAGKITAVNGHTV